MDEFDLASEIEEMQRTIAMQYRKPILTPCGACYFCSEQLEGNNLFCDADCAKDYEFIKDAENRNGKYHE